MMQSGILRVQMKNEVGCYRSRSMMRMIVRLAVTGSFGLLACGPLVSPSGSTSEASAGGTSTTLGASSGIPGAETSAEGGTSVDESSGVGSSSGVVGTVPMYEACEGAEQGNCLPGLFCTPIGQFDGEPYFACTAQCSDPIVDCETPPSGWTAVCNGFLHDFGPDPFCAIGCDADGGCPPGMVCGDETPPFVPPFYCLAQ